LPVIDLCRPISCVQTTFNKDDDDDDDDDVYDASYPSNTFVNVTSSTRSAVLNNHRLYQTLKKSS